MYTFEFWQLWTAGFVCGIAVNVHLFWFCKELVFVVWNNVGTIYTAAWNQCLIFIIVGQCLELIFRHRKMYASCGMMDIVANCWVQCADICDASRGTLSSYAYILMVIYFLQQRKPPVVPVLQEVSCLHVMSCIVWYMFMRLQIGNTVTCCVELLYVTINYKQPMGSVAQLAWQLYKQDHL